MSFFFVIMIMVVAFLFCHNVKQQTFFLTVKRSMTKRNDGK